MRLDNVVPLSEPIAFLHVYRTQLFICYFNTDNNYYPEWTAPRWAKTGDIVFFMMAKTSINHMKRLKRQLNEDGDTYSIRERKMILEALQRGEKLYQKYGRKILAVGKVNGDIVYDLPSSEQHWKSRIYAPIDGLSILDHLVSIDEFRSFLTLARQATITPVLGESFEKLKKLIMSKNEVPQYFADSPATPMPLSSIDRNNWITYGNMYRRRFFLEDQVRHYYVDYLLQGHGDTKKFYSECCYRKNNKLAWVDNLIKFQGKYLTVEVKLSIHNEADLPGQLSQYCHTDQIGLNDRSGTILSSRNNVETVTLLTRTN